MGLYASVDLVFGIDFGDSPAARDVYADCDGETEGLEFICADRENDRHYVLCAVESRLALLDHKSVEVAVVDPAGHAEERCGDAGPWAVTLAAFCDRYKLPQREPRWLVVSDVS